MRVLAVVGLLCGLLWYDPAQAQTRCGEFDLPCWTNTTRPSNPGAGTLGYNTSTMLLEYFNGSIWTQIQTQALPTIANNTDLKTIIGSPGAVVERLGFATAGDGGRATYIWSASVCTLNAGVGDNGYQVKPTSGGGCWVAQLTGSTDVRVWGAPLGTAVDDGAIWQAASDAMVNAGFNTTLECNTTTNILTWLPTNSNLIVQGNGACVMNAASTATTSTVMISYVGSGNFTIDRVNFVAPIFNFHTYALPVVNKFIRIAGTGNAPASHVTISNVSFVGGQQAINSLGAEYLNINNFFADRQRGDSISISVANSGIGSLNSTTQHIRITDGWCRGVGAYCIAMPSGPSSVVSLAPRDLWVSGIKTDFAGFIALKYCYDLVGDSVTTVHYDVMGSNCRQGGIEVKGNPDGNGVPNQWSGIHAKMVYTSVWDLGQGMSINYEIVGASPNLNKQNDFDIFTSWTPPAAWMASTFYDVGDAVQSNGFTLIAISPGTSSSGAGPASAGVVSASVSAAGTGYGTTQTGNMTWSAGGGGICSVAPVLNVTTNAFGEVTTVNSIVTPGNCAPFPSTAGTWTASAPLSAGSGATFSLTACNHAAGNDVVDGTVTWLCVQITPVQNSINASTQLVAALIEAVTDVNMNVRAYGTASALQFAVRGSSDKTVRNATVKITGTVNNFCVFDSVASGDTSKVGIISNLNIIEPSCTCGRTDGGAGGVSCAMLGASNSTGFTNNIDATISGGVINHIGGGSSSRGTAITCTGTAGVPATVNLNVLGTRLVGSNGAYNINGCNWTSLQTGGTIESTSTSGNDIMVITETAIANSVTVAAGGSGYTASTTSTMTWAGAGCAVNPILNATSNAAGVITSATVATPGICATWPTVGATTWTAGAPLGAGTLAAFNVVQRGQTKAEVNVGGTGYGTSQTGIMTWSGAGCTTNPQLVVSTSSAGIITTVNAVAVSGVCTTTPSPTAVTWTSAAPLSAGSGTASFNMLIAPTVTIKTNGQIGAANAVPATKTAWSTNGYGVGKAVKGVAGTLYGVSATGTMTWSGAGCTTNPVLFVDTTAGGLINAVRYVLIPGVCSVFPSSTATTWTIGNGLGAGDGTATFTLTQNVVVGGKFVYPPSATYPSTQKCNWGEIIPIDSNNASGSTFSNLASGNYICALPGTTRQWLGGVQTLGAGTTRLPVCSVELAGLTAYITDGAAINYNIADGGGGAFPRRVLCDGAGNWLQG